MKRCFAPSDCRHCNLELLSAFQGTQRCAGVEKKNLMERFRVSVQQRVIRILDQ